MIVKLRPWTIEDAAAIAETLNNKNVQDNLRDNIPFPYTEKDGKILDMKLYALCKSSN